MSVKIYPGFFLILILAFTATSYLFSQSGNSKVTGQPVLISKLNGQIHFDGKPDEEIWNTIEPSRMIMHSPVFGKETSEETDVRITYDDSYFYAAAWLYCSDPGIIRSASYKRDFMGAGSDMFGLYIDTYNDNENSMAFFTTPDALRYDAIIQKDAVISFPDQLPMNISWNTFWDVKTQSGPQGWSVEMRIPLSSLRFVEINGEVQMGLTIQRWIPAKNETDVFPAIPPDWGSTSIMKPSQAQDIIFRGIKPDKPLYIAPYVLAGFENTYNLNGENTSYDRSGKPDFEAGLDLKYGITKSLIMDVTVNTDFAQVEADDQQINLTRYSLYFPEKRMFFLEQSSIFDFSLGGRSNLFYSRRIGLSDNTWEPVRIYGGARLTGRIKKWEVGFLELQTAPLKGNADEPPDEVMIPSENFGALRFRKQVFNENSYIGTIATSRVGADGTYNFAYGLDGVFRVFGNDYLDIRWSQTFENDVKNKAFKEPTLINARWERRTETGLGYHIGYTQSGIHFNPGIGFEMMQDYSSIGGSLRYGWISPEKSKLYSHSPEIRFMYRRFINDGTFMNFTNFTGWRFQTKNQWIFDLNVVFNIDNLRDSLTISEDELYILPGKYTYSNLEATVTTPQSRPFYAILMTETGQYYDGERISFRMQPVWNISKHFEIGGTYNLDYVSVRSRNVSMINHIAGIKALYMLNTKLSVNAFIQYNTAVNGIITNIRFRYNPKEGNDLYIVFNEDRNSDLDRELPELPVYNSRAIMLKYTYTFNL